MLPKSVFTSPEYALLSPAACKVLLFVHLQYTSKNNGDLSITAKKFAEHGFKSKDVLWRAKDELLEAGWLQLTRQGGLHQPSLFALTWESIDASTKYDAGIRARAGVEPVERREPRHARYEQQATQDIETRVCGSRRPARDTDHIAPRYGPHCPATRDRHLVIKPVSRTLLTVFGAFAGPPHGHLSYITMWEVLLPCAFAVFGLLMGSGPE